MPIDAWPGVGVLLPGHSQFVRIVKEYTGPRPYNGLAGCGFSGIPPNRNGAM